MRNKTPPYILAYVADAAGCGYHRIAKPIELLTQRGYALGRTDFQIWPAPQLSLLDPNIIVWQRQHEDYQISNMELARQVLPNAFLVYEIDDILSACPEWSPHKPHIPYDVDQRMTRAIKICDAITVSTKTLGNHIRKLVGDDFDIRIVPNTVSRSELAAADAARTQNKRMHFKPRIGWGGGISHGGDLDLLVPAIKHFKDKIDWVFLGQKPPVDIPVEFHEGVPPQNYLAKLAALDLDLMVAPLADVYFNRCKSNLRLLEGGACRYPVIASPVEPYLEGNPPVYAYAEPDEWIDHIGRFLYDTNSIAKGSSLRQWVERNYIADDLVEERMKAWSPKGTKIFIPKRRRTYSSRVTVVASNSEAVPAGYDFVKSFDSLVDKECDILYLRKGAICTPELVNDLVNQLKDDMAAVCPLSNDGGFPKNGIFIGIDDNRAEAINRICHNIGKDLVAPVPFCYGPIILLSRKALDSCGFPDITSPESVDYALTEWGAMTTARGFKSVVYCGAYGHGSFPAAQHQIQNLPQRLKLRYNNQNPQDILPDFRVLLELAFYKEIYDAPLPSQNTTYDEWYSIFDTLSEQDLVSLDQHNTSFGVFYYDYAKFAKTEMDWVLFSHRETVLPEHVIYYFDKAFSENPNADIVYADHDFLDNEGKRERHDFKPLIFDYDLFLGRDYITPICAVRREFVNQFLEPDAVVTSTNLYELVLELYKLKGQSGFYHIPRILAHLKLTEEQIRTESVLKRVVANFYLKKNGSGIVVSPYPAFPKYSLVDYARNVPNPAPKVSIIIPTKNKVEMLSPCIESLIYYTNYPNYEVLIVDNGSTNPLQLEYQRLIIDKYKDRLRILHWDHAYNWASLNNWAAKQATGDYLLFLNDDTRFAEPLWLTQMVGAASRKDVGAVGAKLLYSSGAIQHIGVVCSKGLTGHVHKMYPGDKEGYNGIAVLSHASTAVTGACFLISKDKFYEVGGLNNDLAHNFNDVAICLELNRRGYANVIVCSTTIQHLEGLTRISPSSDEGFAFMQKEIGILNKLYPEDDRYWNTNLLVVHSVNGTLVSGLGYELLRWPPEPWPWRNGQIHRHRILLIGDDGTAWVKEGRAGNLCYLAMLNGYNIHLARPALENVPMMDIRDQVTAKQLLDGLGIDKIVVRSVLGGITETLPFLTSLGYPIEYYPNSAEAACPRLDCTQNGILCAKGWQDLSTCISCLETYNSPFGRVSPITWREYWKNLIDNSTTDYSAVPSELLPPLQDIYCGA